MSSGLVLFILASTPFVPEPFLKNLERTYPVPSEADQNIEWILVLGGGHVRDTDISPTGWLNKSSIYRINKGVKLAGKLENARLMTSGYASNDTIPHAEIMAKHAEALGIASERISTQPEPMNTIQEARYFSEVIDQETPFYLVTSAFHIPRAMMAFRNESLDPVPYPVNYYVRESPDSRSLTNYLPSANHLRKSERLAHEYLGIIWTQIGGY